MTEREIFLAVLDQPDPAARAAYLERACQGNANLRARVDALLRSHDSAGSFLGTPAVTPPHLAVGTTEVLNTGNPEPSAPGCREAFAFLTPSARPDALGRLGHYEILQVLGRGGFGIVFRAFDDTLRRVVAVKVLTPELAATSPARKRFLREARSSAQVQHENVVQIYAVEEQPLPYLVMELVPGQTLQQYLDQTGPLEVGEVVRIGRQIAEGLAAAHDTGLIHRDIKPANILIDAGPRSRVKITDFGLARAADDASVSQSGLVAGTPLFMSPEQAKGDTLDHRSDLFSLGSVLYTMTTGRPPFRANGALAVLKRVAEDSPRPIREIIPETPPWLIDLIARLHAREPGRRFQSARELADVLARYEAQLNSGARLNDLSLHPRPVRGQRVTVAVALVLLGLIALLIAESAGMTQLFRRQPQNAEAVTQREPLAPPGQDSEVQRIAALPVAEQIEAVRRELMRRNPDFDGKIKYTSDGDAVTGLEFAVDHVTDISPVRALQKLTSVHWGNGGERKPLADLSPLKGMALTTLHLSLTSVADLTPLKGMRLTHLYLDNTAVADLSPLQGMPLQVLNCSYTPVKSLAPLKGMSPSIIWCNHTNVADLSPLKGMPLQWITIQGTKVTDLSPLKGMPLDRIYLDFEPKRDGALLHSLTTLQQINDKPADEFLKDVPRN